MIGSDVDQLLGLVSLAGAGLARARGVRVVPLELLISDHQVLECVLLPATLAAVRRLVARHELLLRQRNQLARAINIVRAFNGSSGREGPARAAVTLVLDRVHGTDRSPVDRVREVRSIELLVFLGLVQLTSVTEQLLVLFMRPRGELVVAKLERGVRVAVDSLNLSVLGSKLLQSELVLFSSTVGDTILAEMSLEGWFKGLEVFVCVALVGFDANECGGLAEELHFQK